MKILIINGPHKGQVIEFNPPEPVFNIQRSIGKETMREVTYSYLKDWGEYRLFKMDRF